MSIDVVGIFRDLVLRRSNCLADAPDLEVKSSQAILKQLGVWIGVQCQFVLLDCLGGVVRTASIDCHIFVKVR